MSLDITKIDIKRINDKGQYEDINGNKFRLTDQEIIMIRNYYNNNYIARKRLNLTKKYNINQYRPIDFKYTLVRSNDHLGIVKSDIDHSSKVVVSNILGINLVDGIIPKVNQEEKRKFNDIKNSYDREDIIRYYSNVYCLNYDRLYDLLRRITSNFNSTEYKDGLINGLKYENKDVEAESEEELLIYFIRALKINPGQFGLYKEDIIYERDYEYDDNYLAIISKLSNLLHVDRCLVAAIVKQSSGFDSEQFNELNNPALLKAGNEYIKFSSKEEGFIELCLEIKKVIEKYNIEEIRPDTLRRFRKNAYWVNNVYMYYQEYKLNEDLFRRKEKSL